MVFHLVAELPTYPIFLFREEIIGTKKKVYFKGDSKECREEETTTIPSGTSVRLEAYVYNDGEGTGTPSIFVYEEDASNPGAPDPTKELCHIIKNSPLAPGDSDWELIINPCFTLTENKDIIVVLYWEEENISHDVAGA